MLSIIYNEIRKVFNLVAYTMERFVSMRTRNDQNDGTRSAYTETGPLPSDLYRGISQRTEKNQNNEMNLKGKNMEETSERVENKVESKEERVSAVSTNFSGNLVHLSAGGPLSRGKNNEFSLGKKNKNCEAGEKSVDGYSDLAKSYASPNAMEMCRRTEESTCIYSDLVESYSSSDEMELSERDIKNNLGSQISKEEEEKERKNMKKKLWKPKEKYAGECRKTRCILWRLGKEE